MGVLSDLLEKLHRLWVQLVVPALHDWSWRLGLQARDLHCLLHCDLKDYEVQYCKDVSISMYISY